MSNQCICYTNYISLPTILNKAEHIFWASRSDSILNQLSSNAVLLSPYADTSRLHSQNRLPYPFCLFLEVVLSSLLAKVHLWPSGELDKETDLNENWTMRNGDRSWFSLGAVSSPSLLYRQTDIWAICEHCMN